MPRGLRILAQADAAARTVALSIAMLLMVALACICLWQVVARFLLAYSSPWTEGLARAFMMWSVFLALPTAFREGAMVAVELFRRAPERWHGPVLAAAAVVTCLLLFIVALYGAQMAHFVRGQRIAGLGISIAWLYAAVPLGCALSMLSVICRALAPATPSAEIEYAQ